MSFESLGLTPELCRAAAQAGYAAPTPIQGQAAPFVLQGRDLLACAPTGTGKTLAYGLPLLQRVAAGPAPEPLHPRTLVLVPTRELAHQVVKDLAPFAAALDLRLGAVSGGTRMQGQILMLEDRIALLAATPGRLLDLQRQGALTLRDVEALVLDEADRMLDLGFGPDLQRILRLMPEGRQTLLFSATFPDLLRRAARAVMRDPAEIQPDRTEAPRPKIRQRVLMVDRGTRRLALLEQLRARPEASALIFVRTRHGAERLSRALAKAGVPALALHGERTQAQRAQALDAFRTRRIQALVATDLAGRGLHLEGLPLVVNYDLARCPDDHLHRIGRTGRAGAEGEALTLAHPEDRPQLIRLGLGGIIEESALLTQVC